MFDPDGSPRSADRSGVGPRPAEHREQKGSEVRERIITEATALFLGRGYEATALLDIIEAAEVSSRTFYFYFDSKAHVALARFYEWVDDLLGALADRPEGESPEQMMIEANAVLRAKGYATGERLRDGADLPIVPVGMGVLFAEANPEVAGRIYHSLVHAQHVLTALFRRRLDYPPGSLEPRIIAAAFVATWFVAVHGWADLQAVDPDPPPTDALSRRAFHAYATGIDVLWGAGDPAGPTAGPGEVASDARTAGATGTIETGST